MHPQIQELQHMASLSVSPFLLPLPPLFVYIPLPHHSTFIFHFFFSVCLSLFRSFVPSLSPSSSLACIQLCRDCGEGATATSLQNVAYYGITFCSYTKHLAVFSSSFDGLHVGDVTFHSAQEDCGKQSPSAPADLLSHSYSAQHRVCVWGGGGWVIGEALCESVSCT